MCHVLSEWQPNSSIGVLKRRAQLFADIRRYFESQGVLEVHTPTLAPYTVTCPNTEAVSVNLEGFSTPPFLQTSPEYALKRLIAAGVGDVYQLGPAYRDESIGRWHHVEFTMLEWYRMGVDDLALIEDVATLLKATGVERPHQLVRYQATFLTHTGLDPLQVSPEDCVQWLQSKDAGVSDAVLALPLDGLLQYLFATYVETQFDPKVPIFVTHFPANQAALARLDPEDPLLARRFELYFGGLECANGFDELTDPAEQRSRFELDQQQRAERGLPARVIDPAFMAALEHGLPACAGVALGVDRLLAAIVGAESLAEVMPFHLANHEE